MILVVNLNLAVDYLLGVRALRPGEVHRATGSARMPGGKGVNAARVLKTLGEPALLTGFLGGRAGEEIADGLRAEGVEFDCVRVGGESRTCLILCDDEARAQTVVNEPGPVLTADEWGEFNRAFTRLVRDSSLVVITGSLPPGPPADSYARLVNAACSAGKETLLDCGGPVLSEALKAGPRFVKVNGAEAAALLGREVEGLDAAAAAAAEIVKSGAGGAMVTLGALGAVLDDGGAVHRLTPPRVEAANSVGSGDAALAGLAAAMRRGQTAETAGRLAVAAGAANALRGTGRCTAEEIEEMLRGVVCETARG